MDCLHDLDVGGEALKISLKGCSWTTTTREGLEGTAVAITQAMRACKMSIKCLLFGLNMFRGLQNTVELGCIGCGQRFEGKENLEMHLKSVHNDCPDDGPSAGKDEVPEGWDELSGGAEDTVEVDLLLVPIPSPIGALSPDLALEQVYEGLQVANLQPRDPQPDLAKCRFMGVQLLLQLQPGAGLTPAPVPGPGPGVVGEIFLSLLRFLDACPAPQEASSPAQFQTFPGGPGPLPGPGVDPGGAPAPLQICQAAPGSLTFPCLRAGPRTRSGIRPSCARGGEKRRGVRRTYLGPGRYLRKKRAKINKDALGCTG